NVKASPVTIVSAKNSATLTIAREELQQRWQGKAGATITLTIKPNKAIHDDGYRLMQSGVEANTDLGILYGVYELLRRQETGQSYTDEISNPSYQRRMLNHWDNLNSTIERGYAGPSIFWRKDNPFEVTDSNKLIWKEYAQIGRAHV